MSETNTHGTGNYWTGRRLGRRTLLRGTALGAAGLAGAALIGCGGGAGKSADTPAAATTPGAAKGASLAPAARKRGGTLKFGHYRDEVGTMSPRGSRAQDQMTYFTVHGDSYVYVTHDGKVDPAQSLFESYEYPDPKKLVAHLRKGVTFHDGTPFDSAAVKAHLSLIRDPKQVPKFGYTALLSGLSTIETPSATDVVLNLKDVDAGFVLNFGVLPGMPFSLKQIEKLGDDEYNRPAMTGPYKIDAYTSGKGWTEVKNEAYWGAKDGPPYLDKIEFKAIPQNETRAAALEAGDIDAMAVREADASSLRLWKSNDFQKRDFEASPDILALNQNLAPLDNLRVRQGIACAIDRKKVLETIFTGQGAVSTSLLTTTSPGYSKEYPYPFDLERAKKFIADSGVKTPIVLKYYVAQPPANGYVEAAALYQQMLKQIGIDLRIENVPNGPEAMYVKHTHHIGQGNVGPRPDPVGSWALYIGGVGDFNAGKDSKDPVQKQLDDLLSKAKAEFNAQAREAVLQQIHKLAMESVWSAIPTSGKVRYVFARKNVAGMDHPELVNTLAAAAPRPKFLSLA